jgi:hypothetical protein
MLQPRHLNNFNHPFNIYVPSAPFVTFHRTSTRPLCFAFGPANLSSQAHAAGLELVTPPRQRVTASSSCSLAAATTLSIPAILHGAPNQEWEWCFIHGGTNKLDGQRKSALATRESEKSCRSSSAAVGGHGHILLRQPPPPQYRADVPTSRSHVSIISWLIHLQYVIPYCCQMLTIVALLFRLQLLQRI